MILDICKEQKGKVQICSAIIGRVEPTEWNRASDF